MKETRVEERDPRMTALHQMETQNPRDGRAEDHRHPALGDWLSLFPEGGMQRARPRSPGSGS